MRKGLKVAAAVFFCFRLHVCARTFCQVRLSDDVIAFQACLIAPVRPRTAITPTASATQSEEEALTAKIIHYFSLGVLQLPEGITLRAYLAQKLDCDPMRITKKFTGTNCLGKRVYHTCERTTATYEVAKQALEEVAELEERFRARLERNKEKRTGISDIEVSTSLFVHSRVCAPVCSFTYVVAVVAVVAAVFVVLIPPNTEMM